MNPDFISDRNHEFINVRFSMEQRIDDVGKTRFLFAHHSAAPAIKLPRSPQVEHVRTLRLDLGESARPSHLELGFQLVAPPHNLQIPSSAYSDALTFLNLDSLTQGVDQVGIFQYRRILGVPTQPKVPVLHRYRIQSAGLLRELETFAVSHKDSVLVANPLRVTSLEDQYASSQARTLPVLRKLRETFQNRLENLGYNLGAIKLELFYWSSIYLGPRTHLLEFQGLLIETFQTLDLHLVPNNLSPYESRWAGFVTERLFSDFIQCLAYSQPASMMFAPAIQLNRLPGASKLFPARI